MKPLGKILIVIVFLVVAGGATVFFIAGPQGLLSGLNRAGSAAGDWAGRQVLKIAETYIEPKIDYGKLEFSAPGTVRLTDVTFTAADGTEVVRAGAFVVTLAEIPRSGEPIVIEAIALENWSVQLLTELDSEGEFQGFKGLLPFVKEGAVADQDSVDEEVKLSNIFRIRNFKLSDGTLVYDAGDGSTPMQLDDINLDTSVSEDPDTPGAYGIALQFDRAPVLDMDIEGTLDIDAFTLDLSRFALDADIEDERALTSLPPQIQSVLRSFDAKGRVQAGVDGMARLTDPLNSSLNGSVTLNQFNVAQGEFRFPIDRMELPFTLSSGMLTAPRSAATLLEGQVELTDLNLRLTEPMMPMSVNWNASNLKLQDLLRQQPSGGEMPKLAGNFESTGNVSMNLEDPMVSLGGGGRLDIAEGRVLAIPVITDLFAMMDVLGQVSGQTALQDSAEVEFNFAGDAIELTRFVFENPIAAARGSGTIKTDTTLDLTVNAGPLERVTGQLGDIGGIIGRVTDQLVKYRVRGTTAEPEISVAPLGIGG